MFDAERLLSKKSARGLRHALRSSEPHTKGIVVVRIGVVGRRAASGAATRDLCLTTPAMAVRVLDRLPGLCCGQRGAEEYPNCLHQVIIFSIGVSFEDLRSPGVADTGA